MKGTECISIEPLDENALDEVMAIEQASFPEPWSRRIFMQEIQHASSVLVVMRCAGAVIGYGGYWRLLDEAHITNVAIEPDRRRMGYGSRLLKWLIESAHEHGVTRATLEVRESNLAAKRMYSKFGFETVAIRRGYYAATRENAVIMWKTDVDKIGYEDA